MRALEKVYLLVLPLVVVIILHSTAQSLAIEGLPLELDGCSTGFVVEFQGFQILKCLFHAPELHPIQGKGGQVHIAGKNFIFYLKSGVIKGTQAKSSLKATNGNLEQKS